MNLPAWASSKAARDLIAAILAENPANRIVPASNMACSTIAWRFDGRNADKLRKMHETALKLACEAMDEAYLANVPAELAQADFKAIAAEDADQLISRLMSEAAQGRRAAA